MAAVAGNPDQPCNAVRPEGGEVELINEHGGRILPACNPVTGGLQNVVRELGHEVGDSSLDRFAATLPELCLASLLQ